MRRILFALVTVMAVSAGRADAVTVRDVIELSKAGLAEPVLLALIDVDRSVFSIDTATLKHLKAAGVSDAVIIAMIHSGRDQPAPQPPPEPVASPAMPEPEPEVATVQNAPPALVPVAVPYYVPYYVPVPARPSRRRNASGAIDATAQTTNRGEVRSAVPERPNCVTAAPVYWGFGGKLRPDSWQPPPTMVCR